MSDTPTSSKRGTHPRSLANLRRGNVPPPTKKRPPKPKTNAPAHMQMMNARRRELAEARRLERERLATQPVEPGDISEEGVVGEPVLELQTRTPPAPPVAPSPETWTETPVTSRTVSVYDETIHPHRYVRRQVVGRASGSNPFLHRNRVASYPVLRAWVPRVLGWRATYWCRALDVLVDEDVLDRLVTPETGPSDGDRRADLALRDRQLVLAGKPLPASPVDTFPRIVRGLHLEKLG